MAHELTYVALGDSLTAGAGVVEPADGLVARLAARLATARSSPVRVVNLGVDGATIADLVEHQLPTARDLLAAADLVTVCIGSNDAGRTDPADFATRFAALCDELPVGALVADLPSFQAGYFADEAATLAATCREVLASRPWLRRVAVEAATVGMSTAEFSAADLHPNARGYGRYVDAFWATMTEPVARRGP